jgi:hypothetical protein
MCRRSADHPEFRSFVKNNNSSRKRKRQKKKLASACFRRTNHPTMFASALFGVVALVSTLVRADSQAQWFTQLLDHFNPQDSRTWQQKFYVNDTFFVPGGPIFFQIGGEGPISFGDVTQIGKCPCMRRSTTRCKSRSSTAFTATRTRCRI